MRAALLSPYDGGSHRDWSRGLRRHCATDIDILALPARFWKWRMHGGALTMARRFAELSEVDLIVATDMLDVSTFLALSRARTATTPVAVYMHENQLTYPLPARPGEGPMRRQAGERDRHYAFINLTSMLAADRVIFNSHHHRDAFLGAAPALLRHFPDHREMEVVERVAERSEVLPVGVELRDVPPPGDSGDERPPLILWNQRWEYDKNPEAFFAALLRLADAGESFRVALCGQRFARRPRAFEEAIAALGDRVVHAGWLPRPRYVELLGRASVVLSTAHHEFFGISVVEAICAGAWPVLPRRLSYPELLPEAFHADCLYGDESGLDRLLRRALRGNRPEESGRRLAESLRRRYAWATVAPLYDAAFRSLRRNGATIRAAAPPVP